MRTALALIALVSLAGCVSGSYRSGDRSPAPAFGEATRANIAAQTAAASNGGETADGARAALAIRKYQTNTAQTAAAPTASGVGTSH